MKSDIHEQNDMHPKNNSTGSAGVQELPHSISINPTPPDSWQIIYFGCVSDNNHYFWLCFLFLF